MTWSPYISVTVDAGRTVGSVSRILIVDCYAHMQYKYMNEISSKKDVVKYMSGISIYIPLSSFASLLQCLLAAGQMPRV